MEIDILIDRQFASVSVLEEMSQIAEWLKESPYLAIVDEELQTIGILLPEDVLRHPQHLVIDCDFRKPAVQPDHSVEDVCALMQQAALDHLPVFQTDIFIGVISLTSILAVR
jgi:predicted transcriptional regulator